MKRSYQLSTVTALALLVPETALLRHPNLEGYPTSRTMAPTPTVTIYLPGPLRVYCAGASQLAVSAGTVRAALEDLEQNQCALYRNVCDETGAVRRHLNIFVNSDNVRDRDGVDTTLKSGDVVTILPAVSGG
ncbi:MAG TPA: MoaD/ThiS family protein [Vicinamibacterales bacterium]|jgi:molybdopterin converting factor small subunit